MKVPCIIQTHLNPAQREFIVNWLAENKKRPSSSLYAKQNRAMEKIPTCKKPSVKKISNVRQGFNKTECVPTREFNALVDIASGWAIRNKHDSGNNHCIVNAGVVMLSDLWNCWSTKPEDESPLVLGPEREKYGVYKSRMYYECLANGILTAS